MAIKSNKLAKIPAKGFIKEGKGSPRGLVPSAAYGRFDEPFNSYLAVIDPRTNPAAQHALAASSNPLFREFLARLTQPRYARYSLAAIAKTLDLTLPQFADFWQKSQHMRALATAQDGVVEIAADMVTDARTTDASCPLCSGYGWTWADDAIPGTLVVTKTVEVSDSENETSTPRERKIRTCPDCAGKGTVRRTGDTDSRKLLLEMTGHIGKRGGATVQINQNFSSVSMESAVTRLKDVPFDLPDDAFADITGETADSDSL